MMYCQGCGAQMHEQAAACPSCGKPNTVFQSAQPVHSGWLSFRGRITRKVYWLHYILPITAIGLIVGAVDSIIDANGGLSGIVTFVMIAPQLAASVKRLHDRNYSGWFVLVAMIPVIGWLWFFIEAGFISGTPGMNRFGPNPVAASRFSAMRPASPY